ncbi:MAG: CPBP family intramembrane metalloprotease [Anaerolineaceae bacterium]|nr:CPBP family intramembrane metalloprotease [Anaerolineaceae bacterium]
MEQNTTRQTRSLPLLAWMITLLVSTLPNIIWQEFFGPPDMTLFWAKIVLLTALLILSFFWQPAKQLRLYFLLILLLFCFEEVLGRLGGSHLWTQWFPPTSAFVQSMFGTQLLRIIVALLMTASMLVIFRKPARFFLTPGKLDAPSSKVFFLIDEGTSWKKLGWILSACITLGTLAFLVLAGKPTLSHLSRALPMLPFILILAAMNAFSEELNYRAALLAPLFPVVGKTHSILMTAVFFGLGHFYGVPYGIIGVIMASILGYFLSKSMVETKGFFWPWFIHFWQDVAIFSFMAIGSVMAGGE